MARDDKKADVGGHWFLRAGPDTVYGELTLATLSSWAEQGRVTAQSEISNNGRDWVLAETVPELKMDWLVMLKSGAHYGPLNLLAVPVLFQRGFIDAAAVLENKITHRKVPAAALLRGVSQEPSSEPKGEALPEKMPPLLVPVPPAPPVDVTVPRPKLPPEAVAPKSPDPAATAASPAAPLAETRPLPLLSERERQLTRLLEQANAGLKQLRAQQDSAAALRDRMAEESKGKVVHLERENEKLQQSIKATEAELTRRILELQAKLRDAEQARERVRLEAVASATESPVDSDIKTAELTRALVALQAASKALRQDLERERQSHVETRQQLSGAENDAKRLAAELRAQPAAADAPMPKAAVEAVERLKRELASATAAAAVQARERQSAYEAALAALRSELDALKQQLVERAAEYRRELDAVTADHAAVLERVARERETSEQRLQAALSEAQAMARQREQALADEAVALKTLLAAAQGEAATACARAAEQESALQALRDAAEADRLRQATVASGLDESHRDTMAQIEARARETAQRQSALATEIEAQRGLAAQASARVQELEAQVASVQSLQQQATATHERTLQSLRAEHEETLARMRRESEAASAEFRQREADAKAERERQALEATAEASALRAALAKFRQEAGTHEMALSEARSELGALREQLAARATEYATATEKLRHELLQTRARIEQGAESRQAADQTRVAVLEAEVADLQARLAASTAEASQWVQQLESLEAEFAAAKAAAAAQAREHAAARQALVDEHAQALRSLGAARDATEAELRASLEAAERAHDAQLQTMRAELVRLEDALSVALADAESRLQRAVRAEAQVAELMLSHSSHQTMTDAATERDRSREALVRDLEAARAALREAQHDHQHAVGSLKAKQAEAQAVTLREHEALARDHQDRLDAQAESLRAERERAGKELRTLREALETALAESDDRGKALESLQGEISAIQDQQAKRDAASRQEISRVREALQAAEAALAARLAEAADAAAIREGALQREVESLGQALDLARSDAAAATTRVEDLERERVQADEAHEKALVAVQLRLAKSTETMAARLESLKTKSKEQQAESAARIQTLRTELREAKKSAAGLTREAVGQQNRVEALAAELQVAQAARVGAEAAHAQALQALALLQKQVSSERSTLEVAMSSEVAKAEAQQQALLERLNQLRAETAAREAELSRALEAQRDEWVDSTERADAAVARISQLESELANVRSKAEQAAATIATLQTAQREASGREQALESNLAGLRVDLQAARDQHAREFEQARAEQLSALTAGETRLAEAQEALTQAQAEARRRAEMVEFLRAQIVPLKETQSGQDEAVLLLKREMAALAAARQRGAESEGAAELRIRELAAALEEARVGADMQSRKLKALEDALRRRDAVPATSIRDLEAQVAALRAECDALRASRDEEIQSRQLAVEQRESAWQLRLKAAEQAVEEARETALADRQREMKALREALGPLSAMAQQLSKSSDPDAVELASRWFLRPGGGDVLGPVALRELVTWAEECRIGPDAELSSDGEQWNPVTQLGALHLEWMVPLVDGGRFGPVNLKSIRHLVADGVVVADGEIEHVDGLRRGPFAQMLMAEADQALNEARSVEQGLAAYQRTAASLHSGMQALDAQLASRA